ncbi:hypothetical protein EDB85DRAFT_1897018 [Lactarius pseudohatsudake]|nr:hypothetical protein EDB85DRAFT_1897018 [Lactarius pseudohatsudake]
MAAWGWTRKPMPRWTTRGLNSRLALCVIGSGASDSELRGYHHRLRTTIEDEQDSRYGAQTPNVIQAKIHAGGVLSLQEEVSVLQTRAHDATLSEALGDTQIAAEYKADYPNSHWSSGNNDRYSESHFGFQIHLRNFQHPHLPCTRLLRLGYVLLPLVAVIPIVSLDDSTRVMLPGN